MATQPPGTDDDEGHEREGSSPVAAADTRDASRPRAFLIARFALLIAFIGLALLFGGRILADGFDVDTIRAQVDDAGPLGWAVFFVLYVAAVVLLAPGTPISLLGAALFGFAVGFPLVWAGAVVGTLITFLLARHLGAGFVETLFGERVRTAQGWTANHGLGLVLLVRLVPLFPFNFVNYFLGLTRVRVRDYVIGTALGIIPGTALFMLIGANAIEVEKLSDLATPGIILPLLGLVILSVGGVVVARRLKSRAA